MANGNGRDRIALGVTDCERATLGRHRALSAVYSYLINRTGSMLATFTAKLATLTTADLLELIRQLIAEEVFNACFDAALDEACNRDADLAFTIEAMWA